MIVIWFLILLTVIVFVHELGHYFVARINGVRVEVFSIGFGKELIGINDKLGTRWKICLCTWLGRSIHKNNLKWYGNTRIRP